MICYSLGYRVVIWLAPQEDQTIYIIMVDSNHFKDQANTETLVQITGSGKVVFLLELKALSF